MNKEQLEKFTSEMIEALEKLDEDNENGFECPFLRIDFNARNLVSKKSYTGVNVFRLAIAQMFKGYKSGVWATFKQWQEKGCHVRKGEQATMVIWCKPVKQEVEVTNENGETEIIESVINVAKAYYVFNAEQVDGYEPENKNCLEKAPKDEVIQFFDNIDIKQEEYAGRAFYRPSTDTVYIPSYKDFKDEAEYVATLAHEYCHATGAKNRLNRESKGRFGDEDYAFEELVAEIGAGMVSGYLGYDYAFGKNNLAYLKSWLKVLKNEPKAIIKACSLAQKACDWLIEASAHGKQN